MRPGRIGKAARLGDNSPASKPAPRRTFETLMTLAILFAFASAACLGAGVVTTQFGLRTCRAVLRRGISVPAFTLAFLLLSPLLLVGEPVVWRGLPIFAAIGLVFPALLTLLTFASNRSLGPVVTSTLGNLAPLFAVALAVRSPARAAPPAAIRRPRHRGGRCRDHHRHPAARSRRLADLGAVAAARRRLATRRDPAVGKSRARDLAQPAVGLPDRLRRIVPRGADRSARPQGAFRRHSAMVRPALFAVPDFNGLARYAVCRPAAGPMTLVHR